MAERMPTSHFDHIKLHLIQISTNVKWEMLVIKMPHASIQRGAITVFVMKV